MTTGDPETHREEGETPTEGDGVGRRRGQLVIAELSRDYGKLRPLLVVQDDAFADLPSVVVCAVTGELRRDADLFRLDLPATPLNGLREDSQIQIDKIGTVPLEKIKARIGVVDPEIMKAVDRALLVFLGLV